MNGNPVPFMIEERATEPELTARPTSKNAHRQSIAAWGVPADHRSDPLYRLGLGVIRQAFADLRHPKKWVRVEAYEWLTCGPGIHASVIRDDQFIFVPLADFLGVDLVKAREAARRIFHGGPIHAHEPDRPRPPAQRDNARMLECMSRIVDYVERFPGSTISELALNVEHHYADFQTARTWFHSLLSRGRIEGVTTRKDGKYTRVYLEDDDAQG